MIFDKLPKIFDVSDRFGTKLLAKNSLSIGVKNILNRTNYPEIQKSVNLNPNLGTQGMTLLVGTQSDFVVQWVRATVNATTSRRYSNRQGG